MLNVGILVYDDVEVLDFAGPFQVFTTAARVARPDTPFATFTVGQSAEVLARGGLAIEPSYTFGIEPHIDVLIVPGGIVTEELGKPAVIDWIAAHAASAQLTASVCTGAFLLAKAGVLEGSKATTHWEDVDDFRRSFPGVAVDPGARWVEQGNVVTSAGISAGIDMSLDLVRRLAGEPLALRTARQMDYRWQREP
ncbi:MAG TPA: DJ-1/PfpI family protein [Gammaproteobacteria bacterium]|jgi:transcriptional regulator GlxA family with amidase domain|nr:DJ-1/PfpI family protein [Gammaproteobacteria bacterium]